MLGRGGSARKHAAGNLPARSEPDRCSRRLLPDGRSQLPRATQYPTTSVAALLVTSPAGFQPGSSERPCTW